MAIISGTGMQDGGQKGEELYDALFSLNSFGKAYVAIEYAAYRLFFM